MLTKSLLRFSLFAESYFYVFSFLSRSYFYTFTRVYYFYVCSSSKLISFINSMVLSLFISLSIKSSCQIRREFLSSNFYHQQIISNRYVRKLFDTSFRDWRNLHRIEPKKLFLPSINFRIYDYLWNSCNRFQ
jgi:hypothetical protein